MDRKDAPSEDEVREAREILSRVEEAGATALSVVTPVKQRAQRVTSSRVGRGVRIAVNYLGTLAVSLYSTLLTHLARLGKLDLHQHLFTDLKKNVNPSTARALLKKIGVTRTELDAAIRTDPLFREYCETKTRRLKDRAARNEKTAIAILTDPKICDGRGRWHADIDEAVSILYGRRAPNLPGSHKNVNTLRRAKLLFNVGLRGTEKVCYLYDQKHFRLFERARALAGE